MLTLSQKQMIIERYATVKAQAITLHNVPEIGSCVLRLDLKGLAAGQAHFAKRWVRLNQEAAAIDMDRMLNKTIPHEIAHLVVRAIDSRNPFSKHSPSHGRLWQRVCLSLGGTAERCHKLSLTKARNRVSVAHVYRLNSGREVKLSSIRHKRLQIGKYRALNLRDTNETILASHYVGKAF